MYIIRSVLLFSGISLDIGLQHPLPLDTKKNILLELSRRVSSASISWFNYLQAVKNGSGEYTHYFGVRYKGEVAWGLPNGKGVQIWSNGDRYEGQITWGMASGDGFKIWHSGDRYEGKWNEGKQHGHGICSWSNGDRYEGEWKEGKQHGHGVYSWSNGDCYNGQWRKGWPSICLKNPNMFTYDNIEELQKQLTKPPICKQGVILESTYDYNGALCLRKSHSKYLSNALAFSGVDASVIPFSSASELHKEINNLDTKIDLVWLRAHGGGLSFSCSKLENETATPFSRSLLPKLSKTPTIVLESCSLGKPDGFAEQLLDLLCKSGVDPTIIAPTHEPVFRGFDVTAPDLGVVLADTSGINRAKVFRCLRKPSDF